MKKIFFGFAALLMITACNNETAAEASEKDPVIDSLENQIEKGHVKGMAKMGSLVNTQNKVKRLLDSIAKLPAKTRNAASAYKVKLDSALSDLNNADYLMNTWMTEYSLDSMKDNVKERINYLTSENGKLGVMNKAIQGSLARADSVLRSKF